MKLSRRMRTAVGMIAALALTTVVAPSPAHAVDVGQLAFEGSANLPTFPCNPINPQGQPQLCNGTFNGRISGALGGLHLNNEWELNLANAAATASFGYADHGDECQWGYAAGTVNITAGAGSALGVYGASPLPLSINSATMRANFQWQRIGTTAEMQFSDLSITIVVFPNTSITVTTGDDDLTAVAGFAPTNLAGPPDCEDWSNPQQLSATVAGVATLPESDVP